MDQIWLDVKHDNKKKSKSCFVMLISMTSTFTCGSLRFYFIIMWWLKHNLSNKNLLYLFIFIKDDQKGKDAWCYPCASLGCIATCASQWKTHNYNGVSYRKQKIHEFSSIVNNMHIHRGTFISQTKCFELTLLG